MLSVFCPPGRYTQGRGATESLGEEMKKLGLVGTALIVASHSPARLLRDTWRRSLGAAGIEHVLCEFGGQCSTPEIQRATRIAADAGATVIIGAGGGKVLDTARAVAADLDLPVVSCPTVASSDSSCSALSVVYTPEGEFQE